MSFLLDRWNNRKDFSAVEKKIKFYNRHLLLLGSFDFRSGVIFTASITTPAGHLNKK